MNIRKWWHDRAARLAWNAEAQKVRAALAAHPLPVDLAARAGIGQVRLADGSYVRSDDLGVRWGTDQSVDACAADARPAGYDDQCGYAGGCSL